MASHAVDRSSSTRTSARTPLGFRLNAPQRFLLVCGLLLIASGLVHGAVLLLTGGSWEGPLSLRKPMVFGLSFGITAVTIALVHGLLRTSDRVAWTLLGSLGVASVAETGLITMQTWRGVPSHFNFATAFDTAVFIAMGALVMVVAVVLLALTVLAFTSVRRIPKSLALAIRVGMTLLIAGQVLGVLIVTTGVEPAAMGNEAAVFGPHGVVVGSAGILKYPHGIALHAIQILPVIALFGLRTTWSASQRIWVVAAASIGYLLITAISTGQAYTGRGGLTLSWFEFSILIIGAFLLIGAGALSLMAAARARVKSRGM